MKSYALIDGILVIESLSKLFMIHVLAVFIIINDINEPILFSHQKYIKMNG